MTQAGGTTFHLVRHASHGLLAHTLAGRMAGVPLSEGGRAEAARLAQRLDPPIAAVITSPVQRAVETAAPIAARLGLVAQVEPGLAEIDFGAWTGRRFDDLAPDPAWQAWNRMRGLVACPGGESMHQAQSRALAALDRLRLFYPDQVVVLVSHADILKALLAPALGLPLDRLYRLTIDPASISTLIAWEGDWRVEAVNR